MIVVNNVLLCVAEKEKKGVEKMFKKILATVACAAMLVTTGVVANAKEGGSPAPEGKIEVKVAGTTYNKKAQKPSNADITVTVDGEEVTDFTVTYRPTKTNAGSYMVGVKVGEVTATGTWTIHKANQSLRLTSPVKTYKGFTRTYTYSSVKKSAKTITLKFSGNVAAVKKMSASAGLSYKSGKLTLKKKAKKGTYTAKFFAPETANYGGSNAITVTVKVK